MKLYVTYGIGTYQAKNYSVAEGKDYDEAIKKVFEETRGHFAFIYKNEEEFLPLIEKYELTEIPLTPMVQL